MASESVANIGTAVSEESDWFKGYREDLKKRGITVDPAPIDEPAVRVAAPETAPWPVPAGSIRIPIKEISSFAAMTCVFVGPPSAGKTCVVAALDAACYTEANASSIALAIMSDPQARANPQLHQDRVNWIGLDAAPAPTAAETVYALELTASERRARLGPRRDVKPLRCVDAPGELYFPQPAGSRDGMAFGSAMAPVPIRELPSANAMVLVVDATRPCLTTIAAGLPALLDRIATLCPEEPRPPSLVARILARLGLARSHEVPQRTRLTAKRVLLLLTKVDVVAAEMARELAGFAHASPAAVAWAIDPVGLALDIVGEGTVRRLCRAIGADAEFAVGICSASGFCSGEPFSGWSRGRSPDERLRAWRPFGIREALQFLALGRCQGTVQRVTEVDLQGGEALAVDGYPFQEIA